MAEGREATAGDGYEWATRCADCGDGVRVFATEEEARAQYAEDAAHEDQADPDDRHLIVLLRRPLAWETITTTAWEGRRDRI